ncbi:MAG: nicotinamide riboside transporter PnuC [Bacteroidota bacterium]|nr:nicotinamide riboside transporter PnuC [Bacteroidota bacterium]
MLIWIIENYIEIFAALTGFVYIYFSINEKIWLWPWGIATSLFLTIVFFTSKFYADMGLQVYYVIISIYGWAHWAGKGKDIEGEGLPVIKLNFSLGLKLLIITSLIFFLISFLLIRFTDSPLPYWDSFTTSLSIVATWMLARKYIEQWLIWILIDFVSTGLYIYRELYITAILMTVYGILAVVGFRVWQKSMKVQE